MVFAATGFEPGDFPSGDDLANLNLAGSNSSHAVHSAKIHRRAVGKRDAQKNRFGTLQVGMFLQNAHGLAGKSDYRIARFQLFDGPRSGRGVDRGVFRDTGEIHFEPGEGEGGTDQWAEHAATAQTARN